MSLYKARGVSRNQIREYARSFKRLIGVEYELNFPIIKVLDLILPQLVQGFESEILPQEEMGNKHGLTYPSQKKMYIREDVYLRALKGEGRDRLTIAHEIGHLLFHDNDDIALCRLDPNQKLKAYEVE